MTTTQLTPAEVGIRNVLIATDFSHCSNQALNFGLELAQEYQAKAAVVFVLPADEFMMAGADAYAAAKDAASRDLLELKTELWEKHSYIEGEDYQLFMLEGDVALAILDFACRKEIDLVIVGTHGRGGLGRAFMGSVAERIFRQCPVPVLIVGPHLNRNTRTGRPKNILVPVDFSPASEQAVRYAIALIKEHNAKLTVLHVIERWPTQAQSDHREMMQALRGKARKLISEEANDLQFDIRIEVGRVVETVLYTANGIDADLLVIGVRSRTGLLNRMMWPLAYEIVREATCPVLTIRDNMVVR
jgi:nucleotide-binding universal stress UspA family protein